LGCEVRKVLNHFNGRVIEPGSASLATEARTGGPWQDVRHAAVRAPLPALGRGERLDQFDRPNTQQLFAIVNERDIAFSDLLVVLDVGVVDVRLAKNVWVPGVARVLARSLQKEPCTRRQGSWDDLETQGAQDGICLAAGIAARKLSWSEDPAETSSCSQADDRFGRKALPVNEYVVVAGLTKWMCGPACQVDRSV
jgi:hypothetical protein